jgi:hypothetical protein
MRIMTSSESSSVYSPRALRGERRKDRDEHALWVAEQARAEHAAPGPLGQYLFHEGLDALEQPVASLRALLQSGVDTPRETDWP